MIAKYLATSLAMLKVVSAPRVMRSCFPISTISISLVGFESRSTRWPASFAACVPVFMATATSACASAGASFVPSPVIATRWPCVWYSRISRSLSSGVASARKSSTPASAAIAAAVSGLSPVIITVLMPTRRSSAKRSRMPPVTMSLSWAPPRTFAPSATTRGVAPSRATRSTSMRTAFGSSPPCSFTKRSIESAAPFRMRCPSRSAPLMRVVALKGTKRAPSACTSRPRTARRCFASTTMLRPSGVSSASEASCAASPSSRSVTPGAGRKATASRFPSVIVPVLSSSSTSTSPAASTARPEVAITLAWIMRSMPAMPIADSSPPIVVGMRHTRSAASTVMVTGAPTPAEPTAYCENGSSVTVASRKTMVRPASRMSRAISFGVFWRLAPSTRAIMRSRNASPGFAMTRTMSQSERTSVPPVTELRSPPPSRITGALSPVMALSLTEATPSTISPSAGITSPASTRKMSFLRSEVAGSTVTGAPRWATARRLACTSRRARRSEAAWALPRPSAIASAKFAKSTVNHSHTVTQKMKPAGASPWPITACSQSSEVRMDPTYTTNMTGLRTWRRGVSLRNESSTASPTMVRSNSGRLLLSVIGSASLRGDHRQVLDDRAQGQGGDERQRADEDDHADQQCGEQGGVRRQRARPRRHDLLPGQRARDGEGGNGQPVAREQHGDAQRRVVEGRVGAEPREGAAVVVAGRREGIQHLAEPVGPGVEDRRPAPWDHHSDGRPAARHGRRHQDHQGCHLHLVGLDLLAEVLGSAAHHQACHEDGDDGEDDHAVQPDAAVHDLAQLHEPHWHQTPDGREGVVHGVDRSVGRAGGRRGPQRGIDDAEAGLLALHVSAGLGVARRVVHAEIGERVAPLLGDLAHGQEHDEDRRHGREDGPPLPRVLHHGPDRVAHARRDEAGGRHFDQVR